MRCLINGSAGSGPFGVFSSTHSLPEAHVSTNSVSSGDASTVELAEENEPLDILNDVPELGTSEALDAFFPDMFPNANGEHIYPLDAGIFTEQPENGLFDTLDCVFTVCESVSFCI